MGAAKILLGRHDEAVVWLRRSIEANPNNSVAHFRLAAALAHVGRLEEARAAGAAGLALHSQYSVARHEALPLSDNPVYLAGRKLLFKGLRKAGLPEGGPAMTDSGDPKVILTRHLPGPVRLFAGDALAALGPAGDINGLYIGAAAGACFGAWFDKAEDAAGPAPGAARDGIERGDLSRPGSLAVASLKLAPMGPPRSAAPAPLRLRRTAEAARSWRRAEPALRPQAAGAARRRAPADDFRRSCRSRSTRPARARRRRPRARREGSFLRTPCPTP